MARFKSRPKPQTLSKMRRMLDFGNGSMGLEAAQGSMPLALVNPHIRGTGEKVNMMCFINSTLQLLAASKVCREHCKEATGPVAQILQHVNARDDTGTKKAMDNLLTHVPKRLFPIGNKGCAMEFMTWSVDKLGLGDVRSAVTRTVTEQKCLTCKAAKYSTSGNHGYDDATCEVTVKGDITKRPLARRYNVRVQQCWENNCPSTHVAGPGNRVQFREILYYGTVVIFRWGTHNDAVCLQKQIGLLTADRLFSDFQVIQYRLCAYTVFYNDSKHYKTFRFENEALYCCDDCRITEVAHDFSKPVGQCVMALYERGICEYGSSLPTMPCGARHLEFSRNENPKRKWVKVHGDGFCWIYAFLVAISLLSQEDFPKGDLGFECAPSKQAISLSTSLAPCAFFPDARFSAPQFVNGKYSASGTEGGHSQFRRLFARIRPKFRFFVLDPTHTWIRYAAFLGGVHHELPDEIMRLFGPADPPCAHVLEYDASAPQLKMVFAADEVDHDANNILCLNTDVVVCWATENHFNALSPGSPADPEVTRLFPLLLDEPSRVPELFPLEEPDAASSFSDGLGIMN